MHSILRKSLSFIMVLCLTFFSLVAVVKVSAAEYTVKYNVTGKTAVTVDEAYNNLPSGSGADYSNDYGYAQANPGQLTAGKSSTLTLTGYAGKIIKSITLSVRSNTSKGAGSLSVKIGETEVWTIADSKFSAAAWNGGWSTTYVDKTKDSIDTTVGEGENITITITASANSLYCQSYTIVYDDDASAVEPSISLSTPQSNAKVGEKVQLTATAKNFGTEPTISYTSSDDNIATVDADGLVTAVGMGEATITASAGTATASVTIKVYPDNANPITVAEAIAIAEATGTSNSPYQYTVVGTVSSITSNWNGSKMSFNVDDETGSILAYGIGKEVAVDDKVQITGYLVNYNSNTPEFVSGSTCKGYYSVTFTNEGVEYDSRNDVLEGSKITAPVAPTKVGYTFLGWLNGTTYWDFENDVVTSNLELVADWQNNLLNDFVSKVNSIQSYMKLAYKYTVTELEGSPIDEIVVEDTGATGTSYVDSTFSKNNATYAANNAMNSSSYIQLRSSGSTSGIVMTANKTNSKVVSVTIKWASGTASGRVVNIYGSATEFTNPINLYDTTSNTKEDYVKLGSATYDGGTSEVDVVTVDTSLLAECYYIGIRSNSGALYLESVSVEFESAASVVTYSDVDFRVKFGVDAEVAELTSLLPDGESYTYGIQVSDGTNTKEYATLNDDESVKYVVIGLGDVLNYSDRLTTVFTVKAYVDYNGERYYSSSKSYSVASIVAAYKASSGLSEAQLAVINDLYAILESLGCYAE